MMVFCDSALLSQLTTFEFHGGEPGHALHKWGYQKLVSREEDAHDGEPRASSDLEGSNLVKPQNSAQEKLSGYSVWTRVSWISSKVIRYPFLVVLVRVCAVLLGRVVVSTAAMRAAETASKSATQVRQSTFSITSPP
jgi:hypothetical protein